MSMIYTASPARTAWIHRMIYYPDTETYDLVPEYGFPYSDSPEQITRLRPDYGYKYCGAVVQPLRFDRERQVEDERGVDDAGTGVMVLAITSRGEACWWHIRRADEDHVGVEGIVL